MAYSTEAAVRTATGFSNTTQITSATITAYLADADSVINAKIADIYSLPLASTPEIIETLARYITVGLLYANEYGEESENLDKGWQKRLDWAMGILDDIQSGKVKLYNTSNVELTRSTRINASFYPTTVASEAGEDAEKFITMRQKF